MTARIAFLLPACGALRALRAWPLLLTAAAAGAVAAPSQWVEPTTGMAFVDIPGGCFPMGLAPDTFTGEDGNLNRRVRASEAPVHEACVDRFWLGRFEVTRGEWAALMGGSDRASASLPVTGITRAQAQDFAKRLSANNRGDVFRLPTEAEWEYACRSGASPVTRVPSYDTLDDRAWYSSPYVEAGGHPGDRVRSVQPVGGKAANAWGLHDMLGNVWEWVADDYRADAYARHALHNPRVADAAARGTLRGGGLRSDRRFVRCEARSWLPADEAMDVVGFRLVREAKEKTR